MRPIATLLIFVHSLIFGLVSKPIIALDVQKEIIQPAQALLDSDYCYRSSTPPCFDCSGFVTYLYGNLVEGLPRISRDMARYGNPVDRSALEPGDLLFFATGRDPSHVSHVAIYIGQNSIIHAISDGPNRGVTITELSTRYWRTRYHSARRVLPEENGAATDGDVETVDSIEYARGTYSGELLDGEPNGPGSLVMRNGDLYVGNFVNGYFDGEGTYTWADGSRYTGEFSDGAIHGTGTYVPAEGPSVDGEWNRGTLLEGASSVQTRKPELDTYFETRDSPWETWNGVVTGDFYAWIEEEQDAFEAWKANN